MKKRKIYKVVLILTVVGVLSGAGIAYNMFNQPHRNIQNADVDYKISVSELVSEYLNDSQSANNKYLSEDGESKILNVNGIIKEIRNDLKGQTVIILKSDNSVAGVNATLDTANKVNMEGLTIGKNISIKGVIKLGASYDSDMELYQNVVLDKGTIL